MLLKALHNKSFNVLKSANADNKSGVERNIYDIVADHIELRNVTILENPIGSVFDAKESDDAL